MAPRNNNIKRIALEDLLVDLDNPRYDPRTSQREALATIAAVQDMKLVNLAEHIAQKGLNPSELPIVTSAEEGGTTYIVLEGNRRVAALKLVSSPELCNSIGLSPSLTKRYRELHDEAFTNLPSQIDCVILNREDANEWILLKHTGENEGVGVVGWNGLMAQRFRGSSPALQALEFVEKSDYLDNQTRDKLRKISITNIGRFLGTPEARKEIGVDVIKGKLQFIGSEREGIARLSIVISDVANKKIKVTDLDSKDQRIGYARDVASRPLPEAKVIPSNVNLMELASLKVVPPTSSSHTSKSSPAIVRRNPPDRNTLIPKSFKLQIEQTRINQIYYELQKLKIDQSINSIAVLFRVFIELSIDHFGHERDISFTVPGRTKPGVSIFCEKCNASLETKPITLPDKDMTLREKITCVIDHLDDKTPAMKNELKGIRALVSNKYDILSVDSLNAYCHNKEYSPTQKC
jgi:hypothetical protein